MNCRVDFDRMAPGVARAERLEQQHLQQQRSGFKLFDYEAICSPDWFGKTICIRRVNNQLKFTFGSGTERVGIEEPLPESIKNPAFATTSRFAKGLDLLSIGHFLNAQPGVPSRFIYWREQQHDLRDSWLASWFLTTTDEYAWHEVANEAESRWRRRWTISAT